MSSDGPCGFVDPLLKPHTTIVDKTARFRRIETYVIWVLTCAASAMVGQLPTAVGDFLLVNGIGALLTRKSSERAKANTAFVCAVIAVLLANMGIQSSLKARDARSNFATTLATLSTEFAGQTKAVESKLEALGVFITPEAVVDPVARNLARKKLDEYQSLVEENAANYAQYQQKIRLAMQNSDVPTSEREDALRKFDENATRQNLTGASMVDASNKFADAANALLDWGSRNQGHIKVLNEEIQCDQPALDVQRSALQANLVAAAERFQSVDNLHAGLQQHQANTGTPLQPK